MTMRILRIAAVTAGLVVACAAAGGVVGATLMTAFLVRYGEFAEIVRSPALVTGAAVGAVAASFLGPLAAWVLMRRVPLGRAIGGAALGTFAGGLAGLLVGNPPLALILSLVGFLCAVLKMWGDSLDSVPVPRATSA